MDAKRFLIMTVVLMTPFAACADNLPIPSYEQTTQRENQDIYQMYQAEDMTRLQAEAETANLRALDNQIELDQQNFQMQQQLTQQSYGR